MKAFPPAASLAAALVISACTPERVPSRPAEIDRNSAATPQAAPATSPAPASPAPSAATNPALAIDAEGLRLFDRETGAARPIAFGTPRTQALAALAFRGPPQTGTQSECGAGALDYAAWPDGLKVYFQRDRFVGWAADRLAATTGTPPAIATAAGIGPGSNRSDLTDAYAATFSQTSLGTEFAAGGLYGLLDGAAPTATISNMWAGVSCNFR